jgi:hypothetical protein
VSKEYVILKGISGNLSGYQLDSAIAGGGSYKEFKGLFMKPQKELTAEGSNDTFTNGFKTTNNKSRWGWVLRTVPITYPKIQIFIDNYFNDPSGSNIKDVINSKNIWIRNDHLANGNSDGSNTFLWYVPPTEADANIKNRNITITSFNIIQTEGNGGFYYHLEITIEPAIR